MRSEWRNQKHGHLLSCYFVPGAFIYTISLQPWGVEMISTAQIKLARLRDISCLFSSVQSFSRVRLFATPWIAACQASLSITNSQSLLKLMPIELVMPSSHLILCRPLRLLPPIPLSIRVFSSESTLPMRWPKYWSFSFSISPSNEHQDWSPLGWTG